MTCAGSSPTIGSRSRKRPGSRSTSGVSTAAGWVYDTELPCSAVVTVRNLNEKATLPFFARLQRAFYAERVDITDPSVVSRR